MAATNSVSYICSAGLNSVTSAGSLGPYFAIKYFVPLYNYSFDSSICKLTSGASAAASISALNLTSATASSLSAFEVIFKSNPFGSYSLITDKSVYYTAGMGAGPYYTNIKQTVFDTKVNSLNAKPLSNIVTAGNWTYPSTGSLSASGGYGNVNALSFNPLSASTSAWANYLYRVNSYSPTQDTSAGYARGSFKCRIPSGPGAFKFNAMALFATRVNQFGYDDPGVDGSPFNPTLFAIVVFDSPQIKNDLAGALNAFELNIELNFQLANPSSQIIFVNKDYFSRIPTSNITSAYALSYDGDLVLSTSAEPGSWVPRAKATFVDPSKDQLRLSHDETHFTTLRTKSISPNPLYVTDSQKMSVLSIDTACPDDSLLQMGYQCVATGIKSFAGGCFTSATGLDETANIDFGTNSPSITALYQGGRGGYTFAFGVDSIAAGLVSQAFGLESSAIGFANLAIGYRTYSESPMGHMNDSLPALGGNVALGFGTSASTIDNFYVAPEGSEYESCSNLSTLIQDYQLAGGNFAVNVFTVASGKGASSFGISTRSLGNATASFGLTTSAIGCASVTFGTNTKAVGEMSIASGYLTSAYGSGSFVGGTRARTSTTGNGSFVWGGQTFGSSDVIRRTVFNYVDGAYVLDSQKTITIAPLTETFSESPSTIIFGKGTSAVGYGHSVGIGPLNNLEDGSSFAFGLGNSATTSNTFAIGEFNNVPGFGSFGIGAVNSVLGAYNFAVGENNTNGGDHSYTFGISNTNTGLGIDGSFVIGSFNTNVGNNLVAGFKNVVNGTTNTVFGTTHSVNGNNTTHVGYRNVSTGGNYVKSGFVGGEKSGINATAAGVAFVDSGSSTDSPFSGTESFFGCMFAFGRNTSAMAAGAVALGTSTVASGMRSVSIGSNNQANSQNSIAIGSYATTNGDNAMALGFATANGLNSIAIGKVTATEPNSVVVGNLLGDTSLYSKNIYLSAYRTDGVKSRIQLDADEIILNGYDNDKARYYFGMTLCRYKDPGSSKQPAAVNIKISKVRCDELSGEVQGVSISIFKDSTQSKELVNVFRHKNGVTSLDPLYASVQKDVGVILINPDDLDLFFGNHTTQDSEIVALLNDGWVQIAKVVDSAGKIKSGMAYSSVLNYWLFNDTKYLSVKVFNADQGNYAIDNINTVLDSYPQHRFSSSLTHLGTRVNHAFDAGGNFAEIRFFNRTGSSPVGISTNIPTYQLGTQINPFNAVTGSMVCNFGTFKVLDITTSTESASDIDVDGSEYFTANKILFVDFV